MSAALIPDADGGFTIDDKVQILLPANIKQFPVIGLIQDYNSTTLQLYNIKQFPVISLIQDYNSTTLFKLPSSSL